MKTISLLGSGWLGLPLARQFLADGYRVNASTRSQNRIAELESVGARPFLVDLDSAPDAVRDFLRADILIVNIPSKNVAGFRALVNEIEAAEVEKILFVSSTSVYENVNTTITEADTEYFSQSPLLAIEDLFKRCSGVEVTIVRFGGLIGYSRHPGRFFRSGKIVPNPDSPVNLIHRDDCVEIIRTLVTRGIWGEILNCCADTHPSKRAFYTRAAEALGAAAPEFGESDPGAGKLISNRKVKQLLNYEFRHPDLMQIDFAPGS